MVGDNMLPFLDEKLALWILTSACYVMEYDINKHSAL
jgi:hypothetical protein